MQQRRKPSPNLPEYKKIFLGALTQGLRLIDIKAIWSTWDAPYCDPLTVRRLWYDSRRTSTSAKVAKLLDGGMKVAEIANKLGVSPEAIYLHRRKLKKV